MSLPFYLQKKLATVGITSLKDLKGHSYFYIYQWLKDLYPSLSNRILFDLYSLSHNLPLNSLNYDQQKEIITQFKLIPPHYAPLPASIINKFMYLAQEQGHLAYSHNEVPIGAVVVKDNQIIGHGYNQTLTQCIITAHAEIVALTMASKVIGSHRLSECDLYVTIEPCLMCIGAIIHSRIKRVIFGAIEPKTGAIISQYQTLNNIQFNTHTEGIGPIDNTLYSHGIRDFFSKNR